MTDNQGLLPNNIGITSDLFYDLKPSSGRGRSYRCSIQPTNKQVFSPGDTCIMYTKWPAWYFFRPSAIIYKIYNC